MADTKISALTAATVAADANEFAINEAGTSKKVTGTLVKTYVNTANVFAAHTASAGTAPKHTSGTVMTTPEAGAYEYDGTVHYTTHAASERGVNVSAQHITLTSAYTLTSQTALQKMFNVPTAGTITLAGSTTYYFEWCFSLTAMSATSGTYSTGFGGTATLTRLKYWTLANKGAATPIAGLLSMTTVATAVAAVVANTTTTGQATIWGKIVVGTGGTLIPSVGLSIAAAAIVGVDSYFRIWPAGSNTVQSVGNWS